jgi:hypothetical protein
MRLSLGITGHRETNAAYRANADAVSANLERLLTALESGEVDAPKPRLHALLALGVDLLAVELALDRGWQVAVPLPFGKVLNAAINAQPQSEEEALALLKGSGNCSEAVAANARKIAELGERVTCLELAERDMNLTGLFLDSLRQPALPEAEQAYAVAASERAALAGRVMIEQIDLLVAVWDGSSPGPVGGTRHTINRALESGIGVLWIDAGNPADWRYLATPEALANRRNISVLESPEALKPLVQPVVSKDGKGVGTNLLETGQLPERSKRRFHAYRRVEALFGDSIASAFRPLTQHYASEEAVLSGQAAKMFGTARALPRADLQLIARTENEVVRRFARADAISTQLSDAYRGGMVLNLMLAAFAVIGGIAYLPLFDAALKWPFALFEFFLLGVILLVIAIGRKRDWHGRWFQTRRVAEYLRHAPFMLLLGVARPAGSWPHGADTEWPEDYARNILREIGLPNARIDEATLRTALTGWLGEHVAVQRRYHLAKAERLNRIHNNLELISERLFMLAIMVVAIYLGGEIATAFGLVSGEVIHKVSKLFTFLGVALPTLGGALAGIHYFADFGRFAAISESTAGRLGVIQQRIETLLGAPEGELIYARVANLARAVDEIVVSEIEHWQDVFGGKHISVPV